MATADPCSLLIGTMKEECEALGKSTGGSTGGALQDFLGLNGSFDWRHFMIRAAEFGVGVLLIVVAVNAGLKQSVMANPVVKSGKQIGKKVLK
jgi:hypothetical protein